MTHQARDKLTYNDKEYFLEYVPLNACPDVHLPPSSGFSTSRWRGYLAHWQIHQDGLYLVDLEGYTEKEAPLDLGVVFPGYEKTSDGWIRASWFTGELTLPYLDGPGSLLVFRHGRILLEELISQEGYVVRSRLTDALDSVMKFGLSQLMDRRKILAKAQDGSSPWRALQAAEQQEKQFIQTIRLDLGDPDPKLAYADWLEAHEDPLSRQYLLRAEVERWQEEGNRRDYIPMFRPDPVPSGAINPEDVMWFWRKLVGLIW